MLWGLAYAKRTDRLGRMNDIDVLVVGGGPAGVPAAIQAARLGARVMLVEFHGQLGGATTTGGIFSVSLFGGFGEQLISGIGWELVEASRALDGAARPFDPTKRGAGPRPGQTCYVNPYLYAAVAEQAVLEAGIDLRYHTAPRSAQWLEEGVVFRVDLQGKNQRTTIRCRELIDCTGGAEIVGMLGYERVLGDEASGRRQPGTLAFEIGGFDAVAADPREIEAHYEQARADGSLQPGDYYFADKSGEAIARSLQRGALNAMHVPQADDTTSDAQTVANIAGRSAMLRLLKFVRGLTGGEHATIRYARQDTAIRETRRIVGETTVTETDYMTGRVFPDAIGYSMWFIDIHNDDHVEKRFLEDGVKPTIPFSAMVPRGSRHLLAPGRSISADYAALSALRVQASCMAMGQAAGAAAALAIELGCPSRSVPHSQLRRVLQKHGAILPPALDRASTT
ncbi:MAG: FAD-dependent oxidoreductase [Planctomycetota bacterium]